MLFHAVDPPSAGYALNLANVHEGLQPPGYHQVRPEEYLGFLRASYKRDPRPFIELAEHARAEHLTLCSADRPDLVAVLYAALIAVAARRGYEISGGQIAPASQGLSGKYVPDRTIQP
jgi:hypothetical protein